MTTNQIAYWNLEEVKRSNAAKEGLEQSKQDETKRHNIADEKFNIAKQMDNWELEKYKVQSTNQTNRGNALIQALGRALPGLLNIGK